MAIAFVTGGSGFVGRHLITALVARGDSVRALARSTRSARVVEQLGAEAIPGDLSDKDALVRGADGADFLFHVAAFVDDWGRKEDFVEANVHGTRRALAAARSGGVECFVHVGTEAIYAGGPMQELTEHSALPERSVGLYAQTKREAERLVRHANTASLRCVVIRPRLIWGAGDTSVLPRIVEAVESGRWMWVQGGRYLTSTCHVHNVVEGALLAAERGVGGEAYFLSDGEPVEFRQFMTRLVRTQGMEPPDKSIPFWLAHALATAAEAAWRWLPLPGAPPLTRQAILLLGQEVTVKDDKARAELGYRAHITIDEGLEGMGR